MRRREFLGALGSSAAWPLTAHAQRRTPLILVWFGGSADDPEIQSRQQIIRDALRGWAGSTAATYNSNTGLP
jgi:hypothetical protein